MVEHGRLLSFGFTHLALHKVRLWGYCVLKLASPGIAVVTLPFCYLGGCCLVLF